MIEYENTAAGTFVLTERRKVELALVELAQDYERRGFNAIPRQLRARADRIHLGASDAEFAGAKDLLDRYGRKS